MKLSEELQERWAAVEGYEGYYEVSDKGRVRSLDRLVGGRLLKGKVLKPGAYPNKYKYVFLRKDGDQRLFLVHRLVAVAFLLNKDGLKIVNHKDGNKQNNRVENLAWCSNSQNQLHSARTGLRKVHFTKSDEKRISELYASGISQDKIAQEYGVSQVLVSLLLRHKLNYLEDNNG